VFGLAHFDPEAKTNVWPIIAATGVFGLAAADLTARTGSIGAGWGLHLANNLHAVALISLPGPLSGLALYVTPYAADAPTQPRRDILIGTALIVLSWLLCRIAIARLNRTRR
ncbi:MAG: CPBP family intramembrane glutamic endopeptidase, partial [Pseudomonadota bacterium]